MDKPILFSGPMVRALLEGRKTQTRRVIKDRGAPPEFCGGRYDDQNDPECWGWEDHDRGEWITLDQFKKWRFVPISIGDRLFVREAWRADSQLDHIPPHVLSKHEPRLYLADGALIEPTCMMIKPGRFRQGMHMPRWASRLTLTVTDVRVQRVREISDEDAESEGVLYAETEDGFVMWSGTYWTYPVPLEHLSHFPKSAFRDLWDSLNAKRGFGWDANPWVAAYTFTVETRNIDE